MTPEEHQRRGDAADALFREMVRQAAGNDRDRPSRGGTGAATATTRCRPAAEALDEPFRAFPSWFLRITCDRCGKDRMVIETHAPRQRPADPRHPQAHAPRRLRRQPAKAELLTGIEGASSRPVRRILVLVCSDAPLMERQTPVTSDTSAGSFSV